MRARNIKPGFFKNESLLELPPLTRILFEGLWCMADREGRLEDRPKHIKIEVLPADDCDVDAALQSLHDCDLIQRYAVNGTKYIQVTHFSKHQNPHVKEVASTIPAPCKHRANTMPAALIPDSLIPDSGFSDSVSRIPESSGGGGDTREDWNPFGVATETPPETVESYLSANLPPLTRGNIEELTAIEDAGMQPDAIRYAVDQAAAQGKRTWAYVKGILRRWEQTGVFTAGAAKAAEDEYQRKRAPPGRASPQPALSKAEQFLELARRYEEAGE